MLDLPQPNPDALAHSQRLHRHILDEIAEADGWISFDRYWELALYTPGLGYYSGGAGKFGGAGDFTTAPELGDLFARCVAQQFQSVLAEWQRGDILEVGAGTGVFARDCLRALAQTDSLPERYLILERSGDLRERQQNLINQESEPIRQRVQWLDALPETPFDGVIFGNELLDALPAQRFVANEQGWDELGVTAQEETLQWCRRSMEDTPEPIAEIARHPGYRTEVQSIMPSFIRSLSQCLNRGLMCWVDYGYPRKEYYQHDRSDGTLICHYRHRAHSDPFLWPGLSDISVSVDFTLAAESMQAAGLDVVGLAPQNQFLIDCGLEQVLQAQSLTPQIAHQVKQLTLPGEMGDRFLAIAGTKGLTETPPGFRQESQLWRL